MNDLFVLFVILFFVGVPALALYAMYTPVKRWLLQSGRLTRKRSKRITIAYGVVVFTAGAVLFAFLNYRPPGDELIKRTAGTQLPGELTVLRDDYQDGWQDYAIYYDVRLERRTIRGFIRTIRATRYYRNGPVPDATGSSHLAAVWYRNERGYHFRRREGSSVCTIDFDTLTGVLEYMDSRY